MRESIGVRRGTLRLAAWLASAAAILALAHTLLGAGWIARPRANHTPRAGQPATTRPPLGAYLIVPGESRWRPGARVVVEAEGRKHSSPATSVARHAPRHTAPPVGQTRARTLAARKPARDPRPARTTTRPSRAESLSRQPIKAIEGPDIR